MSTKKSAKSKAAPKRKRMVSAKRKNAVPARQTHVAPSSVLEGRTGHWTQWIEPRGMAYLAERLTPCHFHIKNHGPELVRFFAEHGDHLDLSAGKVRATYASGTITVKNGGEKWVLIEFDFLPILRK